MYVSIKEELPLDWSRITGELVRKVEPRTPTCQVLSSCRCPVTLGGGGGGGSGTDEFGERKKGRKEKNKDTELKRSRKAGMK